VNRARMRLDGSLEEASGSLSQGPPLRSAVTSKLTLPTEWHLRNGPEGVDKYVVE
jgi:hypothetical protein